MIVKTVIYCNVPFSVDYLAWFPYNRLNEQLALGVQILPAKDAPGKPNALVLHNFTIAG